MSVNMRVLVIGGAGFIGSNLVEELVNRGEDVTVLDKLSTGSETNLRNVWSDIEFIKAPCSTILYQDFKDFDLIFHFGMPSSSPMYKENPYLVGEAINDFIRVMELSMKSSARVVYASTSSMYAECPTPHSEDMDFEPFDYYTEARLAMERMARMYNKLHDVESMGMRFFSVYGPHERSKGRYANIVSQFYWKIKDDEIPVIYGDGSQTRDFTHVSDVVRACLKASESDVECDVINVGTGKSTSFKDVIELLNNELGKSINPEYIDNPIENYVYHTQADISKARKLLDYEPSVTLEEGINMMINPRE